MTSRLHILLLLALLLTVSRAYSQAGNPNHGKTWIQGGAWVYRTEFSPMGPVNALIESNVNKYFAGGHSSICDSMGKLILVTDGYTIYDSSLQPIENGSNLTPLRIQRFNNGFSLYSQSSIILPFPNGIYRVVVPTVSDDSCIQNWERPSASGAHYDLLLYHEVDMNKNNGAGSVTRAMVPIMEQARLSRTRMMACRHGDGKSWWLFKPAADTNLVYKFLFTADSIYGPYIQGFGGDAAYFAPSENDGQSMFSQDGTRYATTQMGAGYVFVADFDRCSGMLSRPRAYKIPHRPYVYDSSQTDSLTNGLCFSPNGRFLYVSGFFNMHQLDLEAPASASAWTHLHGPDTTLDAFQNYSSIYPGPDGKLYIGNWGGQGGEMSVIEHPDNLGLAAGFCPKCLRFPGGYLDTAFYIVGVTSPPCMPNYALGGASGPCFPASVGGHQSSAPGFEVFPNPGNSIVKIGYRAAGELGIVDMLGRTLKRVALPAIQGAELAIDIADLPAGAYLCRYLVQGRCVSVKKLVVAHD